MTYCILKSYKLKCSPLNIFSRFSSEKMPFFLDSSLNSFLGRYSIIGANPFYVLKTDRNNSLEELRRILEVYKLPQIKTAVPFLGGAVGYISYDFGLKNHDVKIQNRAKREFLTPDFLFGFYNCGLIIDNFSKTLHIFSSGLPEKKKYLAEALAKDNFNKMFSLLKRFNYDGQIKERFRKNTGKLELKSNFSRKAYIKAFKKAKDYIRRGDIYQVNLSQRFESDTQCLPFEIYQRLRRINPTCFSAYFDAGDFQILSSSPERFLELKKGIAVTRPMKGTRARSTDKLKNKAFRLDLLNSAKDKAELLMIVDLQRNDLGRVCDFGSIRVRSLRKLEVYKTVLQATATIEGKIRKDKDRIDLLEACFPGGSITGCPKIRAMEIIDELEPNRRNVYTGCLGYLSFCGNMDFNILIRTILQKSGKIYFNVGGGIVFDSVSQDEYQETLVKAEGIFRAING